MYNLMDEVFVLLYVLIDIGDGEFDMNVLISNNVYIFFIVLDLLCYDIVFQE